MIEKLSHFIIVVLFSKCEWDGMLLMLVSVVQLESSVA